MTLDGPEQKLARMHPQKSAFEERVVNRFRQWISVLGLGVETDHSFTVLATIPDAYVPSLEALVYLDGPVHTPNRADKDEKLRELLKKHSPGLNIQGFKYRADTKAEEERVLAELQKWVEELQKWKTTGSGESPEESVNE